MHSASQQPNRLLHETSPYLKQHAYNPVDWFPWGEEALRRAKELDRPIFLSIGYSACHWCHVMAHESFEDPEVGALLNEHFVNIKVDREERPDLDQIYMTAVQLLTQHGGWPMSVFLTPDLKPFYGGTYFPPADRYGMPSFKKLVTALADAWKNRRDEIVNRSQQITSAIQQSMQLETEDGELNADLLKNARNQLTRIFDARHGGFGRAPKFPHPMELRLLLRIARRFDDPTSLEMVTTSLDHMARGGIYDQLGGGFHRYSTDERWLVPHFEKMLYDNALLTLTYTEAHQVTGNLYYRDVVDETLAYVTREMTSPEGAFYSTQDADSEGVEGKFFVWTVKEIESLLGPEEAKLFGAVYDVTELGNWEGHNILNLARPLHTEAKMQQMPVDELKRRLRESKAKLFAARSQRVWPGRDEKILTAWNALMIDAFAKAAQAFDKPEFAHAAARSADFLLTHMRQPDGRLLRTASFSPLPAGEEPPAVRGQAPFPPLPTGGEGPDPGERQTQRVPRGLFLLHQRARHALRGNLRAALDRGRAIACEGHDRAILGRDGRRLLLYRRRPRIAHRAQQGSAGQRDAVGQLDGRHGTVAAREADGRRRPVRQGATHPAALPQPHGALGDSRGTDALRARLLSRPRAGNRRRWRTRSCGGARGAAQAAAAVSSESGRRVEGAGRCGRGVSPVERSRGTRDGDDVCVREFHLRGAARGSAGGARSLAACGLALARRRASAKRGRVYASSLASSITSSAT